MRKNVAEFVYQSLTAIHRRIGRGQIDPDTPVPYALYRIAQVMEEETRRIYSVEVEVFGSADDPDSFDQLIDNFTRKLSRKEFYSDRFSASFYWVNGYDIPDPNEDLIRGMVVFELIVYEGGENDGN